jgi:hypothetical protein
MVVKNFSRKVQTFISNGIILIISIILILISANKFNYFIEISDGFKYNQLFESLESVDLIAGYLIYINYAAEPFSYLLFYTFAQVVNFLAFNNILNALLLFSIFIFFLKNKVNLLFSVPFIISNYYILLIEYGVIRVKIAIIFLLFSYISKNRFFIQVYKILSALAHFQVIILILFDFLYQYFKDKNIKFDKKVILYFLIIFFIFYNYLSNKIYYYFDEHGIIFPFKVVLFFLFSIIILNKVKFAFISFLLLFPLALILGEGRIVMMYYFLIIIQFVKDSNKKTLNMIFVIFISLYFSIKGLDFANSLISNYDYFLSDSLKF